MIELGRTARDRRKLSIKTPVRNVVISHPDAAVLAEVEVSARPLAAYVIVGVVLSCCPLLSPLCNNIP